MGTFLKIVSYVFQPLVMPTVGMILLMQIPLFRLLGPDYRMIAVIGTVLFTGIFPALPILLMMRKGQVRDLFISRREERTMPYLFTLSVCFLGAIPVAHTPLSGGIDSGWHRFGCFLGTDGFH